jgi:hypothetical protein
MTWGHRISILLCLLVVGQMYIPPKWWHYVQSLSFGKLLVDY